MNKKTDNECVECVKMPPPEDDAAFAARLQAEELSDRGRNARQYRAVLAEQRAHILHESICWHSAVDFFLAAMLLSLVKSQAELLLPAMMLIVVSPIGVYASRSKSRAIVMFHALCTIARCCFRVIVAILTPNFLVSVCSLVLALPALHLAWLAVHLVALRWCRAG